jgi:nitroimidazol reductase NimA-like FMN-containing flavoprotein (pyridoxamine 5'-phosphate oxidase superfamily)
MPRTPLPPHLEQFLNGPRAAVVAVVDEHGGPASTATWYLYENGRIVLSMERDGLRHRRLLANPGVALTVLADDWYEQLSLVGRVVELRDDLDLADIDRMSQMYRGEAYSVRDQQLVTVQVTVDRWHTFGDPR